MNYVTTEGRRVFFALRYDCEGVFLALLDKIALACFHTLQQENTLARPIVALGAGVCVSLFK